MKRLKIIFFLPICVASFYGCKSLPNRINTLYGVYDKANNTPQIISNVNDLDSMIDNHKTFVLIQTSSCDCSSRFINNLVKPYIQENGLLLYKIDYDVAKNSTHNIPFREGSVTFHTIYQGQNLANLEQIYTKNETFFTNKNYFVDYMNNHFAKPTLISVNETELDNLFKTKDSFVVYYAKTGCSECEYLQNYLYSDFAQNHFDDSPLIYLFDLNNYPDRLNELRNKYGLTESYQWGYLSGALPVIHHVVPNGDEEFNNDTDAAFMFGNDILDENYKIETTYYDRDRLAKMSKYSSEEIRSELDQNKQFKKNDTYQDSEGYILLNNEVNRLRYEPLFKSFMNYLIEL